MDMLGFIVSVVLTPQSHSSHSSQISQIFQGTRRTRDAKMDRKVEKVVEK